MEKSEEFEATQLALAFLAFCQKHALDADKLYDQAKDIQVESQR